MDTNRRRLEREVARAREAQRRHDDEARQAAIAEATAFIEGWNARLAAGRRAPYSPTIRAATLAGYRWLTVCCPGCGMVSDIDLSTLDRHADASIMSLIPSLSCRTCRPHAPFARLVTLSRERPQSRRSSGKIEVQTMSRRLGEIHVWLPINALTLSGCDQLRGVYTLDRSSVTAEDMRIHVATFDAADDVDYKGQLFHRTRAIHEATGRESPLLV